MSWRQRSLEESKEEGDTPQEEKYDDNDEEDSNDQESYMIPTWSQSPPAVRSTSSHAAPIASASSTSAAPTPEWVRNLNRRRLLDRTPSSSSYSQFERSTGSSSTRLDHEDHASPRNASVSESRYQWDYQGSPNYVAEDILSSGSDSSRGRVHDRDDLPGRGTYTILHENQEFSPISQQSQVSRYSGLVDIDDEEGQVEDIAFDDYMRNYQAQEMAAETAQYDIPRALPTTAITPTTDFHVRHDDKYFNLIDGREHNFMRFAHSGRFWDYIVFIQRSQSGTRNYYVITREQFRNAIFDRNNVFFSTLDRTRSNPLFRISSIGAQRYAFFRYSDILDILDHPERNMYLIGDVTHTFRHAVSYIANMGFSISRTAENEKRDEPCYSVHRLHYVTYPRSRSADATLVDSPTLSSISSQSQTRKRRRSKGGSRRSKGGSRRSKGGSRRSKGGSTRKTQRKSNGGKGKGKGKGTKQVTSSGTGFATTHGFATSTVTSAPAAAYAASIGPPAPAGHSTKGKGTKQVTSSGTGFATTHGFATAPFVHVPTSTVTSAPAAASIGPPAPAGRSTSAGTEGTVPERDYDALKRASAIPTMMRSYSQNTDYTKHQLAEKIYSKELQTFVLNRVNSNPEFLNIAQGQLLTAHYDRERGGNELFLHFYLNSISIGHLTIHNIHNPNVKNDNLVKSVHYVDDVNFKSKIKEGQLKHEPLRYPLYLTKDGRFVFVRIAKNIVKNDENKFKINSMIFKAIERYFTKYFRGHIPVQPQAHSHKIRQPLQQAQASAPAQVHHSNNHTRKQTTTFSLMDFVDVKQLQSVKSRGKAPSHTGSSKVP